MKKILRKLLCLTLVVPFAASAGLISYTGAIESWNVDTSGTYRITAVGAQGGSADSGFVGGLGASLSGLFELGAGETYFFAVGGSGSSSTNQNGGGGGGSFFVDSSNNALLVAGGGGGTRTSVSQNGCDAFITSFGGFGSSGSSTSSCSSKTADLGQGGFVSSNSWGSAGAGFFSNGAFESGYGATAAISWTGGLLGGIDLGTCGSGGSGGFGGGGSGAGCYGGGGGGGYSGGDGGRIAGGGGSWNTGLEQLNVAGLGTGNGSIQWELVEPSSINVPEPTTLAIFALGMISLASRRFKKQS
jgi:hypothetical protein